MHPIVPRPGFLRGIQIKPGTETKVPRTIRIARHIGTTRAGVRCDDDQAEFSSHAQRAGLVHEILVGTGQPRQPVQHRQLAALLRLRRKVHGKHHVAAQHVGTVTIALVPTAKTLLTGDIFQVHVKTPTQSRPQAFKTRSHDITIDQKWMTVRMLLPSCIRSNALLISSRPMVWVMKVSRGISPVSAIST